MNKVFKTHRHAIITGIVIALLYYLPYMILKQNSFIHIHDNLDSELLFNKLNAKYFFRFSGTIPELMNVDVRAINSFSVGSLLFYALFSPFTAYIINDLMVRIIAFVGMYLVLRLIFSHQSPSLATSPNCTKPQPTSTSHITINSQSNPTTHPATNSQLNSTSTNSQQNSISGDTIAPQLAPIFQFISVSIASLFAILPFYTIYGLSGAGIPMLVFFACKLFKHKHITACYLYFAFYTLNSSLILSGYFIITTLVGLSIYFLCKPKYRKTQLHFYIITTLVIALYLISNIKLILLMLSGYQSHREAWNLPGITTSTVQRHHLGLKEAIPYFFEIFGFSFYHSGSYHSIMTLATLLALAIGYKKQKNEKLYKTLCWFTLLNILLALLNTIASLDITTKIINLIGLGGFNFTRQIHAQPFTWYTSGALSMAVIYTAFKNNTRAQKTALYSAILLICTTSFLFSSLMRSGTQIHYLNNALYAFTGTRDRSFPTYAEIYEPQLFSQISNDITASTGKAQKDYRVASIGMFPIAASMNGFYTIDGYVQSYSLQYWHDFRAVIEPELAKNKDMEQYFNWGNRCYIFASDLYVHKSYGNYLHSKHSTKTITELNLNLTAFKNLGGKFLLSAVAIQNYENGNEPSITKFGEYEGSFWKIYVYKVT